jgi:hypothetical protein
MSESKETQKEGTTRERARTSIGQHSALTRQELIDRWLEVAMAIMLGIVAVATAWSGYQAARWDGEQSSTDLCVEM